MDDTTKNLIDGLPHSAVWFAFAAIGFVLWKILQLFFWSEKRVESIAAKVLSSEPVKIVIKDVAKQVFTELNREDALSRARMEQRMEALEARDVEWAGAVTRAFERQDELMHTVQDLYKLIAGRVTFTPLPPGRDSGGG